MFTSSDPGFIFAKAAESIIVFGRGVKRQG